MPFLDLEDRVREVQERIDAATRRGGHGQGVTIVAVTKTHGPEALQAAWNVGLRDVGENRVQEAMEKMDALQLPFRWHLIGHLQRNKVKHLSRFHMLHSLDRADLANAADRHAITEKRVIDVLVQVNVAGETTKGGYSVESITSGTENFHRFEHLRVRGVMTMAPFGASEDVLRHVFRGARAACDRLREDGHAEARELSMGMSDDYEIAVEEGATFVRLGTVLFGARTTG